MDAVVTETIAVASSSSPSLEKWDSFDIIGDLVDQVELLPKCCGNVLNILWNCDWDYMYNMYIVQSLCKCLVGVFYRNAEKCDRMLQK